MFCPKCGNEIPNQAVFCPKCGESINGSGGQSQPSPTPPETTASPVQKTAGKVHICLLLVSLILVGLWFTNTIVMCDDIDYSVLFALSSDFAGPANEATIIMCVLFCLNLIGSVIFSPGICQNKIEKSVFRSFHGFIGFGVSDFIWLYYT